MVRGYLIRNMVMYGSRMLDVAFILTEPVVTGFGHPNTNGSGFLTMTGVGRLSIMAAGIMILIMVGCGYQITNGRLHG